KSRVGGNTRHASRRRVRGAPLRARGARTRRGHTRTNEYSHCPAPFSSAVRRGGYRARSKARAIAMPRARRHRRQNRLDRWPLAFFRRLVGTEGRVAGRGGHRRLGENGVSVVRGSAGKNKWKLVRRRTV